MNRTIPILVIADETGELNRHYEDCPVCNGRHSVKVYVASFKTWCYEERTCQSCSFFDKTIHRKNSIAKMEASPKRDSLH
ncbi:hypothetical protein [Desulfosporosinus sp. BICA1-9]|uniref:hypothetical protein n=1 Tax=Desulfosporosinus sp. BICA1-9 TaxID=1531958 RepID=UPI0025B98E4C|nr:hypothetical protein [Desulfosporosinus sp. BICA1-9]